MALVFVALLASCAYDEYSIELTPQDDVIQRQLTVRRVGGDPQGYDGEDVDVSAEKLDAIAELYGREAETDVEGGHVFVGEFAYAMPNDVGGAGEYITFATRMGRCSAYIERFRGNDSPAERIQAAFDAADELTDILIGWLEGELGEYEDFPKLQAFLDEQLRVDLKNLSVYLFLLDSASSAEWAEDDSDEQIEKEIVARVAQYLLEHEYILPEEAPAIQRIFIEDTPDGGEVSAFRPFIIKMLRRKADIQDEDMLAAFGEILTDSSPLAESVVAYVTTTQEYRALLTDWEQLDDESDQPDPLDVLSDRVQAIMLLELDIFDSNDAAKVLLHDVTEPVATNGLWDEQAKTVSWSNRLNGTSLPAICYALWAEPDEQFQMQHFGKVVLHRKDLAEHCLWHNSLTDQEATEWDKMIDSLLLDDVIVTETLRAFRFSHEPAIDPDAPDDTATPPTYASRAIAPILRNITADEPEDQPSE